MAIRTQTLQLQSGEATTLRGPVSARASSAIVETAARTRALYSRALIPSAAYFHPIAEESFVGSAAAGSQDMVTDLSYLVRAIPGVGSEVLDGTMGLASGLNIYLGYSTYSKATERALEAQRAGYKSGERGSQVGRLFGATQAVYGATVVAMRGLTVASYIAGVDASSITAPTLLGRVTYIVSTIANVLVGFFYLILTISSGMKLWEASVFRKEFDQSCVGIDPNNREQLLRYVRFFEKWSCADDEEMAGQIFDKHYSPEDLREEALAKGAEIIKALLKESDSPELSEGERKEIALRMLQQTLGTTDHDLLRCCLADMGLGWKYEQIKAKRHMKVANLTSDECVEEMRDVGQMLKTGKLSLEEAQAFYRNTLPLVTKMQGVLDTNFWINTGYFVASLIGITAMIASFFALGPAGALIVTIAFLVVALTMTGLDGYGFYQAMNNPAAGKSDKTLLVISNVIGLLSFAAAIVLVSILSLGIVPLIASITIASFWIGVDGLIWYKLAQNSEERLGLHGFRQLLDTEEDDEKIKRVFKNLPKVDRDAIAIELDQAVGHVEPSFIGREPGPIFFNHPLLKQVVQERIKKLQREAFEQRGQQISLAHAVLPLAGEYFPAIA